MVDRSTLLGGAKGLVQDLEHEEVHEEVHREVFPVSQ